MVLAPVCTGTSLDTRDEVRRTMYRPVLIETEEFAGFCLLRDLSSSGMRGTTYTELEPDSAVTVHLGAGVVVSGTLVWSEEGNIGVEFDEALDVPSLLERVSCQSSGSKVHRSPRLSLQCTGQVTCDGRTFMIKLQDISQRGMKARETPFLRLGEEVDVQIDGMRQRKAKVCSMERDTAGLSFIQPLSFEELAKWAIRQQAHW